MAALVLGGLPHQAWIAGGSCEFLLAQVFPIVPLVPLSGSGAGNGAFSLSASWPSQAGFVFVQAMVQDGGTVRGYAATKGLELASH